MRKIVSGLFMALDGVVEAPNTWQEHFDEDMGESDDGTAQCSGRGAAGKSDL
jgi:hypothetical protein